jgi:hypothetical protein
LLLLLLLLLLPLLLLSCLLLCKDKFYHLTISVFFLS